MKVGALAFDEPTPPIPRPHGCSWVGACPGQEESAGVNYSHRSPKGNRHLPVRAVQMRAAEPRRACKRPVFMTAKW